MKNETYNTLAEIYKNKSQWKEEIDFVGSCLKDEDTKVKGKAIWILGEMGFILGNLVQPYVKNIAAFITSDDALLRERSLNALGRIGRNDFKMIQPYFENIFPLSKDSNEKVRIAFIWACENIATNYPELFESKMRTFAVLLDDSVDRVRIEAPEIFRVIGKRKPEYVKEYIPKLYELSENDNEKVVRIHALGAIKTSTCRKNCDN